MPRHPSFTPSIDDCLTIRIAKLNAWGHLKEGWEVFNRFYIWMQGDSEIGRIGYSIKEVHETQKRMILDYQVRGEPVRYEIALESIPTNLGKGKRWYFVCPHTRQRCMNLICPTGSKYFLHRSAFPDLMYESQKKSKAYRQFEAQYGWIFKETRIQQELNQKYRKRHYRGRPTPLVRKYSKVSNLLFKDLQRMEMS